MTESGFAMPPDHIVFQLASTLDFRSPVIMGAVVPETGNGSEPGRGMPEPGPPLEGCRGRPARNGRLFDSPDLNQQILLGPEQLYERRLKGELRRKAPAILVRPDSRCFPRPGSCAMLRVMKTLAVGILALALLLPTTAGADVSPGCQSAMQQALGGYAGCRLLARAKDSTRPDTPKLAYSLSKCATRFEASMYRALARFGTYACPSTTVTQFRAYIDSAEGAASAATGGDALPDLGPCLPAPYGAPTAAFVGEAAGSLSE